MKTENDAERSDERSAAQETMDSYNAWRRSIGLSPTLGVGGGAKKARTFSLSDAAYEGLKKLSREVDLEGPRGKNVSTLLEGLGLGILKLT